VENADIDRFLKIDQNQWDSWSEWQDLNLRPPRPERGGFTAPNLPHALELTGCRQQGVSALLSPSSFRCRKSRQASS
jgi:hypothetical protein